MKLNEIVENTMLTRKIAYAFYQQMGKWIDDNIDYCDKTISHDVISEQDPNARCSRVKFTLFPASHGLGDEHVQRQEKEEMIADRTALLKQALEVLDDIGIPGVLPVKVHRWSDAVAIYSHTYYEFVPA